MDTKALKKQMGAAIAMVLVAAIALGSATFAWFVSNNSVKAETSTISAQSNAPFLKIDKGDISDNSTTSISFAEDQNKELYPAQVVMGDSNQPKFQSAYASSKSAATILDNSRYDVGTADAAATAGFAVSESFKIGTKDEKAGSFKDLKVGSIEVTGANEGATDGLNTAISVLLVCGDKWAVYKPSNNGAVLTEYGEASNKTSAVGTATDGILSGTIGKGASVEVKAYVFYDGAAEKVYSENLTNLKQVVGLNITFTATPVNTQGSDVNAPNAAKD